MIFPAAADSISAQDSFAVCASVHAVFLEQQLTWVGRIRKLVYLMAMLAALV
jgi:hypothetical protein